MFYESSVKFNKILEVRCGLGIFTGKAIAPKFENRSRAVVRNNLDSHKDETFDEPTWTALNERLFGD